MGQWCHGEMQRYVLTLFLTRCIIRAIPLCIPARRGARSRGVAEVGRGAVLPQVSQACGREALGACGRPWRNASKNRVRGAVRLFPFPSNRAGLPRAPPSIDPTAQGSHALGLRALAL